MKFDMIARNWLAVHGNFDHFDWSVFTNSGIHREDYLDFCYYSAGYHGLPELGVTPHDHFRLCAEFFRGGQFVQTIKSMGLSKDKTRKALGLKKQDYGSFSAYWNPCLGKSNINKLHKYLLQYLLNPSCKILSIMTEDGTSEGITLPQYLMYSDMNKQAPKVTVQSLIDMNIVSLKSVDRIRQAYIIGSSVYTPADDDELAEVLGSVYAFILQLCTHDLLEHIEKFTLLPLNECTGHGKESVINHYIIEMARAASIGKSLNDVMHMFGLNIPDITYSISWFGTPTAFDSRGKYIQFDGNDKLMILDGYKIPDASEGTVTFDINTQDFESMKEQLNSVGRIIID